MVDVSSGKNNITIKVENTNKTNSITTTPSVHNNSISATADTAQYWSKQSRLSAENSKESALESKYYAELANSYIEGFEGVVTNNTNNIIATSNDYINQITGTANTALTDIEDARVDAVDNITTVKSESIASVEAKGNEVVSAVNEGIANIEAKGNEANALVNTGIAEINTTKTEAVNAVTTTKNNAVTEINKEVTDGKKELNDIIEAGGLNINDKITNCLLEVPQNIKLELNEGFLTLKAGSKVIVPNGFEANGTTPKFDEIVIDRDTAVNCGNAGTRFCFVGRNLQCYDSDIKFLYSGATPPDTPTASMRWYDTSSNLLKEYVGGVWATVNNYYSLPFAICTANTNKIFTSIDQVFNGFGYMGSTVWVDKGVKTLIPDGRNTDGTLKNYEYTTTKVLTRTDSGTAIMAYGINPTGGLGALRIENYIIGGEKPQLTSGWWFDTLNNIFYNVNNGEFKKAYRAPVIIAKRTNGVIASFQPKLPIRLVDWNDIQDLGKGGVGLQMFDTILKDHVLTYEESKGLALQGTYVYKNAVAGSRYGYPDFYAKCVEEYNNSTNEKAYIKSNVNITGIIRDNNGIISGWSAGNYATVPQLFAPANKPWEFVIKAKLGDLSAISNIIGAQNAFKTGMALYVDSSNSKLGLALSSNGTSYNIVAVGKGVGSYVYSKNTAYYFKVKFTGTQYNVYYSLDGKQWNLDITATSSTAIVQSENWTLGCGCIGATATKYFNTAQVDLHESYININGSRWWSGVDNLEYKKNSNGHLFYAISNKSKVDEYFNLYGTAWFYGIDTTNERIFLPRNNFFDQATGNSSEVGKSIEAGLPNITGTLANTYDSDATGQTGAFYNGNIVANGSFGFDGNSHDCARATHLDASHSNSIYGASNTVQPNAVKKLLYICVGNTVSESSITDVVDVTTTNNDTVPLFTGMYFDFKPNNASWLKAGQQSNSGGIYKTCYNELVNVLNGETKYGSLKVVDSSKMVSGTDYSLYWKVNQTNQTFTPPTADGLVADLQGNRRVLVDKKEPTDTDTTWYNLYSDGWLEQGGNVKKGSTLAAGGAWNITISLSKSYTSTDYEILLTYGYGVQSSGSAGQEYHYYTKTDSSFACQLYNRNSSTAMSADIELNWQTSGYTEIPAVSDYTENVNLYFKVANAVQNLELLDVGEVMEAVANVADIANNTSNSLLQLENNITTKVVPDYSAGISAATNFVAPVDGVLHVLMTSGSTTTISINGVKVGQGSTTGNDGETVGVSVSIMGKGDVLTLGGRGPSSCKFYPFKGAK